jgi:hypothetical protein
MTVRYCSIVFVPGGGSSWAWASTPEEASQKAAKVCKRDWNRHFKFKRKHEFDVCVYDMENHEGWYANYEGVFDTNTKEEIPLMRVDKIVV